DLIGLPVRVVVGKRAEEGIVEVKQRFNGLSEEVQIDELETYLQDLFKNIK
ncbi:MAG: His/Gly/Thr/Pro-type tRNA ligase C-terminal domain-containing protein, partial [Staphylococcus epidermidis]|nr:His/Gly/Thr/Pro-type tRNA ligase C-terminal domain-containing protein [Staphylococcus epidermidis]